MSWVNRHFIAFHYWRGGGESEGRGPSFNTHIHRSGEPGGWKRREAHHEIWGLLPPHLPNHITWNLRVGVEYGFVTSVGSSHSIKSQLGKQGIPEKLPGPRGRF